MSSVEDALKLGKEGKPVLLFFMDASPKCKPWLEALGDKSLDDVFAKVAYVTVDFKKDGEEEKKWKATAAPTVILIDASKDEAKEIKKLTSPVPATIKKELTDAVKKLEKK